MAALSTEQEQLLHDAAAWRLIGLLFEYPRPGWREQVAALGSESRDERLRAAATAAQTEATEGMYHSLFGPGGPVSPREATYLGGMQLGYLLSELKAYYEAFAYQPDTTEAEDHVAVEAGFLAYLAIKQAYALASDDHERAQVTAEASSQFMADHLSLMVEPIARALEIGGPPYLALAGQALFARVGPPARKLLPLAEALVADDADEDLSCGVQ